MQSNLFFRIIIILGFLLNPFILKSQESTLILSEQLDQGQDFVARDQIVMKPGFAYMADQSGSLRASLNAGMVCNTDYISIPITPDNNPVNTSLPVGSINGNASVSSTGSATYNIPISIPSGIAGMQPSVSIVYNSQAGDGLLGMGWNLVGISSISRVPKTILHDGVSGGITFSSSNDRYAIDGNRLFALSGEYGEDATTYETEMKSFSQIESFGSIKESSFFGPVRYTGPEWFKVVTKEGVIIEYGSSTDSRAVPSAPDRKAPISWLIKKVTDLNGNYMVYKYKTYLNQTVVETIEYTANGDFGPSNIIRFVYDEKDEQKFNYVDGRKVGNSLLLNSIKIFTEGEKVKTYIFNYFKNKGKSFLNVVEEKLGDSNSLNSTIVSWGGDNNPMFVSNTNVDPDFLGYEYYMPYDFDGDGFTDIIAIKNGGENGTQSSNIVQVFKANYEDGNLNFIKDIDPFTYCCNGYPYFNHMNIRLNLSVIRLRNYSFYWCGYNAIVWPQYLSSGGIPKLHFNNIIDSGIVLESLVEDWENFPVYTVGDFNNDGVDEIVYFERIKKNGVYPGNIVDVENFVFNQSPNISLTGMDKKPERIFSFDFNSDGLLDILILNENGLYLYSNNTYLDSSTGHSKTTFNFRGLSTDFDSDDKLFEQGDFNGDGSVDLIFYKSNKFNLAINNGNGSFEIIPTNVSVCPYCNIDDLDCKILDFNNDGKDDFLAINIEKFSSPLFFINEVSYNWYQSVPRGFQHTGSSRLRGGITDNHEKIINSLQVGDFNGDGLSDIFNYGGNITLNFLFSPIDNIFRVHSLFRPSLFNRNLVNSIRDGMGFETSFEYQPITHLKTPDGKDFYSKGSNVTYPLKTILSPLYCVRSLSVPDGTGGISKNEYSYEGAKVHLTGKGFLGFTKQVVENATIDRKTLNVNEIDEYTYLPSKKSTFVSTYGSVPISESVTFIDNIITGHTYLSQIEKVVNTDYLSGNTSTTDYQYDSYGNILSEKSVSSDGVKETEYRGYTSAGSSIPRLPQIVIRKQRHNDDGSSFSLNTRYSYSLSGNVTQVVKNYGVPGKSVTTSYRNFNQWGLPLLITTASSSEGGNVNVQKEIVYDSKGRYVESISDNSGITEFNVDPVTLNVLSETSPNGLRTEYEYDNLGRVVKTKFPDNNTVTKTYQWGIVGSVTEPLFYINTVPDGKPWQLVSYDMLGRKVKTESVGFEGTPVVSEVEYNSKGEVTTEKSYFGGTLVGSVDYTYDSFGRILSEISNTGSQVNYTYQGASVTKNVNGKAHTSIYDSWGNVKSIVEPGGGISYQYHSNGNVKSIDYPGATVAMAYDAIGNQNSLKDPSAGKTDYRYDGMRRITYQKDARNKVKTISYDDLSRVESEKDQNLQVIRSYEYYNSDDAKKGLIKKITSSNDTWEGYDYDPINGRLLKTTKYIDNNIGEIEFSYEYDSEGNIEKVIYPNNQVVSNTYDDYGNLKSVSTNGVVVWSLETHNATTYRFRLNNNQLVTTKSFDSKGFLSSIVTINKTNTIQDMHYSFDELEGNVVMREDRRAGYNLSEEFTYDDVNRLTSWTVRKDGLVNSNQSIVYSPSLAGNIDYKSGVGSYVYDQGSAPHAVSQLNSESGYMPPEQAITYTDFGKVETITENDYILEIVYGPDQQRVKSELKKNKEVLETTYYAGLYEVKVYPNGTRKEFFYIPSANGIVAVLVKTDADNGELYYLHRDHLGSIVSITNQGGDIVEEMNYDPWGRYRNPLTWDFSNVTPLSIISRGYTGHEHLNQFDLINMNGRVYDPILGLFLSPDPYVQAPNLTQNFNRYSYCLNNPLIYTDPSGEFIFTLATLIAAPFTGGASLALLPAAIGADFGTWQGGTLANGGEMNPFKWDYSSGKTWGYMLGGAAVGAASGYVGGAIAAEGGFMANTMGIMAASHVNSVGMGIISGGQTDYTLSFGVASYNFTQGEWGYLGKPGNSALENIGYGFGALANISDAVSLFSGGGQNVDVNSASTKDDWWGHSSMTDENGKTLVSVGPDTPVQKAATLSDTWNNSIKGAKLWDSYVADKGTWSIRLNNVSTSAINNYASGMTRWDLLLNSCVGHTTRALMRAGVPTIYAFHPHMLNLQLLIRQIGIYSSPYLYQIPE